MFSYITVPIVEMEISLLLSIFLYILLIRVMNKVALERFGLCVVNYSRQYTQKDAGF